MPRALLIFKKALGPKHPKVALCEENYAQLRLEMKAVGRARHPCAPFGKPVPGCGAHGVTRHTCIG